MTVKNRICLICATYPIQYIPLRRGTRQYFICAAPKMMEQVELALHQLDVPPTNIHMEHFNLV